MIFAITGTGQWPFDRLVKEVDRLVKESVIRDDVFIQIGSGTYRPEYCDWERFLSFGGMYEYLDAADLIIAHAGAGITLQAIQMGHKPIIVPRRLKYKELVDDHQISFARKIAVTGLVDVLYHMDELKTRFHNQVACIKRSRPKSKHYYQLNDYLSAAVHNKALVA